MKTIVTIPTYNEKENIKGLIRELLDLDIEGLSILVVDDNSPDGTGKLIEEMKEKDPRIDVVYRYGKRGRGLAEARGFKEALARGADYIFTMDADLSHNPKYVREFLRHIRDYDIVIGSRLISKGGDERRSLSRKFITHLANLYIRMILGIPIRDFTSGYRCFKKETLENIDLDNLFSAGHSVIQEVLYKAYLNGATIREIPITFVDRQKGKSHFNIGIMMDSFLNILALKFMRSNNR